MQSSMIFSDMEDNEVFEIIKDEKLISATIESYETGKITPLLKEELKCRILSRCLEEGKDLSPEPIKEPPRKEKVQPDESGRLERRREQNRRAARKFRQKKKSLVENLEEESEKLEAKNTDLRQEINRLIGEVTAMEAMLAGHICMCKTRNNSVSSESDYSVDYNE